MSVPVRLCHPWLAVITLLLFFGDYAVALEVPPLKGRVNDYAGMLSTAAAERLETELTELERTDSTQLVVLTIPSLEGDNLEAFSLSVVERWQIGQRGKDNGALLLIARDDRKLRIEVGYGLEGSLTDLVSGQIIRNVITPQFRSGNFDQGITDGVTAMVAAVRGEFQATRTLSGQRRASGDFGGLATALFFFLFIFGSLFRRRKVVAAIAGAIVAPIIAALFFGFVLPFLLIFVPLGAIGGLLAASMNSTRHSGGFSSRSGGGFGGGFSSGGGFGGFSGGGGGFGGGGASGSW